MITVVAAVIEQDGRILIAQRRPDAPHPLKWEFPGGKVDPQETPEQALARELEEELGIKPCTASEMMRYTYAYLERPPILLIFYAVRNFEGVLRNMIFAQFTWAKRHELPGYDFLEGDLQFVNWLSAQEA